MKRTLLALAVLASATTSFAQEVLYDVDPNHTFPSFEADHMGISVWRGKFNETTGKIYLDKEKGSGRVELTIDLSSVDFGHDKLNEWAKSREFFDVELFPEATFKGTFTGMGNTTPAWVEGRLTMHGLVRPMMIRVGSFRCIQHPIFKRDYCGADALATFQRDEFGLDAGKSYGFDMTVTLRIQVEALKNE